MMAAVAFLALGLAVVVQSVRLNQALVREQRLRVEAEYERYRAILAREKARAVRPSTDLPESGDGPRPPRPNRDR
jgi:hypothetical protein